MSALFGLLAGLGGILLGACLSWVIGRRERRITTTFEMHREFNGLEMTRIRYSASRLLAAHPGQDYLEMRGLVGRFELQDVFIVTRFYQRLWLAVRFGGVHRKYVPELFGASFSWWYEYYFRARFIPLGTEPGHHVRQLKEWMDRHTSAEQQARWREGNRLFPIEAETLTPSPPPGQAR